MPVRNAQRAQAACAFPIDQAKFEKLENAGPSKTKTAVFIRFLISPN